MSDQELAGQGAVQAGESPAENEKAGAAQEGLDPEARARQEAALSHVRKLGDPVLRARAIEVERFDDALQVQVERMGDLMRDAIGVGLAATQLGILSRVLVYQPDPDEESFTALVNPVIEWSSEERELANEGCLSIPGIQVEVERAAEIRVRAQDARGRPISVDAEGFEARVIQHEVDHLDGILMLDRISRGARRDAMRALREAERGEATRDPERGEAPGDVERGEAPRDPERDEAPPDAEPEQAAIGESQAEADASLA